MSFDCEIDCLIDALKWNPENIHVLLMVGNIYADYKNDADTVLDYYGQILALKPDDHLALNNIGVKLIEAGKLDYAKQYLDLVKEISPDYPNTLHALSMLHELMAELLEAVQA
jgi:tetratricopeptide (TPR) repeat protein